MVYFLENLTETLLSYDQFFSMKDRSLAYIESTYVKFKRSSDVIFTLSRARGMPKWLILETNLIVILAKDILKWVINLSENSTICVPNYVLDRIVQMVYYHVTCALPCSLNINSGYLCSTKRFVKRRLLWIGDVKFILIFVAPLSLSIIYASRMSLYSISHSSFSAFMKFYSRLIQRISDRFMS